MTKLILTALMLTGCLAADDTASTAQAVRCNGTCPIEEDSGGPSEADLAQMQSYTDGYTNQLYPGANARSSCEFTVLSEHGNWHAACRVEIGPVVVFCAWTYEGAGIVMTCGTLPD